MPVLLYVDDLVLCDESEDNLREMKERFIKVCRRRVLKLNTDNMVIVLNEEEISE